MNVDKFKDGMIEVSVVSNTADGVEFKCVIQKTMIMNMFGEYDFKRNVETFLAQRIVKDMPVEVINKIMESVDLNNVAKLTTIEMAKVASGQTQRNY